MMKKLLTASAALVTLVACDSGGVLVDDLASLLGAATDHPCADDFAYQTELNGMASETKTTSTIVEGETLITEQHWYSGLQMIVFYTYQENGNWCNMWNESGVDWVN